MKTTTLQKTRNYDDPSGEILSQLRPVKQTGAFFLFLFGTLFFALFLSSCDEDDNEDDMDVQGSNTTLTVSGEVEGEFDAQGQYFEHSDASSGLHVNSFEFLDNFDPSQSTFLISISRFSEDPMELGTGLHRLETSYMAGGETGQFGAGVTWWDASRNAVIYPVVTNGLLRINKISDTHIQGDIILRMATSEYDEVQAELSVDGSFNVPRVEF